MAYTEEEARKLVLEAGLRLVREGLIARTWGNISARISDTQFIITPTGRTYDSLAPEDLVKVNISDLSYEGSVRPSSEKGIHADCYRLRENVDFVIHTHQFYASVVGIQGKDKSFAPCAAYGHPGSKGLRKAVAQTLLSNPTKNNFLLTKHGSLSLGKNYEDAFANAAFLEQKSRALFESAVTLTEENFTVQYSRLKKPLLPYIDDFAMIVAPKLNDMSRVCVLGDGSEEDTKAAKMILEKNCAAALYALKVRDCRPLGRIEAHLQHYIYINKYSKNKTANVRETAE